MVNKGPSTGCQTCRDRRVRCDKVRPFCGNCVSRNRACPGYRDTHGIIIIDVSQQVTTQQHIRARKAVTNSRSASRESTPSSTAVARLASSSSLLRQISPDGDEVAVTFFFTQCILDRDTDPLVRTTRFDHLIPLYLASKPGSALHAATAVLARQAMAKCSGVAIDSIVRAAYEEQAYKTLQRALAQESERTQDETLMAILCLTFVAQLSSAKVDSRMAFRAHIEGAVALIQARGAESFSSEVSQSLYAATRDNVLLQALWSGDERSRRTILQLPYFDMQGTSPTFRLEHIIVRAVAAKQELLYHLRDQTYVAATALQLDTELEQWWDSLPTAWKAISARPRTMHLSGLAQEVATQICAWHCVKVAVLRLIAATTPGHPAASSEMMQYILAGLLSALEMLPLEDVEHTSPTQAEKLVDRQDTEYLVLIPTSSSICVFDATSVQQKRLSALGWAINEFQDPSLADAERFAADNANMIKMLRIQLQETLRSVGREWSA